MVCGVAINSLPGNNLDFAIGRSDAKIGLAVHMEIGSYTPFLQHN